jgi:phosphoribosylformylglycinamidine cyclo-ligase
LRLHYKQPYIFMENRYDRRGVSASKDEVHAAIKHLDKGIFPLAFCKVLPDVVGADQRFCNVMHADTAGTKTSLAYLYWRETGDLSVWKGIAQDAIVMNLDDMGCIGCFDDIVLSSTIGRNKNLVPGEVIKAIIEGCSEFLDTLNSHNVKVFLAGGETADVGDIVRTADVGYTTFARMERDKVVVNDLHAGQVVVGLASYGQAIYESAYNSGIGSNGLTSARHDVLSRYYAENFPDSFDANTPSDVVFTGSKRLTDKVETSAGVFTVGQLLLSPTRTYLPFIKPLVNRFGKDIKGIIHCSGGGQTKVQKFLQPHTCVVKDNFFETPPVFQLIQQESNTNWKEMYQVFNMGCRLEVYLPNAETAQQVIELANSFGIEAQVIGKTIAQDQAEPSVQMVTTYGTFKY